MYGGVSLMVELKTVALMVRVRFPGAALYDQRYPIEKIFKQMNLGEK